MLLPFLASAALIVAASLITGQAIVAVSGRTEATWVAGPVGLAALLCAAGIATGAGGRGGAVAITVAAVVVVSAAIVAVRGAGAGTWLGPPLAASLLAALAASLPFIAAGRIGILGVGLVNDDMASHLLLADWLDQRFQPEPVLIHQGYPLGPHSLVAGLGSLFGAGTIDAFAGLTIAIPMLTAGFAAAVLDGARAAIRILVGVLVALPYMAAAYLAQEAFKEPIMALLLLAFAVLLPAVRFARDALPLAVIAAGAVYVYSFPGLAWLIAAAAIWGILELAARRRLSAAGVGVLARPAVPALVLVGIVLLALTVVDWGRIADFTDFRALDPSRANEGGLGNLRGHLSPLEGLGVWPTSEFRLAAGAGSLPAIVFYLGAALAALPFVIGLPRWLRRHGSAVPAALAGAVVIYVGARAFGTVYTSAKALAIAAPLVTLIGLGGILEAGEPRAASLGSARRSAPPGWPPRRLSAPRSRRRGPPRPVVLTAIAALFALGAAISSFLVLRQAPVGPQDHMDELARMRPLLAGRRVLFLGRDNFVLYELRGSMPFTHVRNFYDPYFVKPNFDLRNVASKFDVDALTAAKLARFPYVITTRAPYASGPPPSFRPALETESYVLWRNRGPGTRRPLETGPAPGRNDPPVCRPAFRGAQGAKGAFFASPPVRGEASAWSPSTTVEDGASAGQSLRLSRGRWTISLQYDATRPLTVSAPGFEATVPANLDYRGVAPFWAVGTVRVAQAGSVRLEASVDSPPLGGRLLGASSVAHLGALAATRAGPSYLRGVRPPFPGQGERLVGLAGGCSGYGDWASR